MRTIKFRAWDGEKYHGPYPLWQMASISRIELEGLYRLGRIEQFTGLKDKNGKEIYEGDVFNCIYHRDGCTEHVFIIEYDEEMCAFRPKIWNGPCQQRGVTQTMRDMMRHVSIGNIHENPELLK